MSILLIYPPAAKICEPPAGIARLAGALRDHGLTCRTVDLNLHCLLQELDQPARPVDTWSRRAVAGRNRHLESLREEAIYRSPDRYRRAVHDLNRVLALRAEPECELTLANFSQRSLSPVASSDLLQASDAYHQNHFFRCFKDYLHNLIELEKPRFIGISICYLSQALTACAILGFIRQSYPDITTIAGGGLVSSWLASPSGSAALSGLADHLICGPGERQLLEIMGVTTAHLLGRPDYTDFSLADYLAPGLILPYAASDGCYWSQCTFCPDRAEKRSYVQHLPERIGQEVGQLTKRHRPLLIHFLDNALSPALLRRLVAAPPSLPWYGFVRFEKELGELDFCRALRQSGCIMLKLGLESGSQRVLDQMHKGIDLQLVKRVLANLKQAGIAAYIYLLFGTPGERPQDAALTMEFIRRRHDNVSFLNLAIFNMPICSPEAKIAPRRFSEGDLSLYCDFTHPHGWDRKAVRQFLSAEFKTDPLIRRIILRDPPTFSSNHAPLFHLLAAGGR